jgi:beta-1,4-N-acetylglucosaminyltransferase
MGSRHRVMLVAGCGGALLDLLALRPWWSRHDTAWAAMHAVDTDAALADEIVHWQPSGRAALSAFVRAVRLLRSTRAELVVLSAGAAAAPFLRAARVLRLPTVWIEPLTAVGPPGRPARSASAVVVQTEAQLRDRPGAVLIGELY